MSKTNISPHMGMAANLGRKPGAPEKTHCIGASRDGVCSESATCALHVRQMVEPAEYPMLLPRVGVNPCHYRGEVAK
jgi:hypothetical protein